MQDQLRALSGNICSEHALSEQISDLREVRATVRERLQITENSLAEARREVILLRKEAMDLSTQLGRSSTETEHFQGEVVTLRKDAMDLSAQLATQRGRSSTEAEHFQSEVVTLRKEAMDLSVQLQNNLNESRHTNERFARLQEEMSASEGHLTRLREEMSASERHVLLEREELRKELSTAANTQIADLQGKHVNAIQQLTLEKDKAANEVGRLQGVLKEAQNQAKAANTRIVTLQNEHMNAVQQFKLEKVPVEEKLKSVTKQVGVLKAEKDASAKEICRLQDALKEAQNKTDAEHQDMQATLKQVNDDLKAKELEIVALQASQATRVNSSRTVEPGSPILKSQATHKGHALRRNSHRSPINETPAAQPSDAESSKHFASRPQVVEDSQPAEKPHFKGLEDLMEDPFADYAQEEPDLSHLFPSTPAESNVKHVDYSRIQVKRTTVAAGLSPILNGRSRKMTKRKSSAPKGEAPI